MGAHLHIGGLNPSQLALDNFSLLGMDHIVLQYLVDLCGMAPGCVAVQDDVLALKMFPPQRQPFHFARLAPNLGRKWAEAL